jgi:GT2 family glycosyltransferase
MPMPRVAFVVVNFNNSSYTKTLCESLGRQQGLGAAFAVDCLVVDNSTDLEQMNVCAQLCDAYAELRYIRSSSNVGYFGGLNRGLAERPQDKASLVVIGNNDLQFSPTFCRDLLATAFDEAVFAVCPDVVTLDGMHQNPHLVSRISWYRRLQFDILFSNYHVARIGSPLRRFFSDARRPARRSASPRQDVHMGIGACYVLTPSFFSKFDRLDYPLFLYGEEAFLSAQIHSAGGRLIYEPGLVVTHSERASTDSIAPRAKYELARQAYWLCRDLL